MVEAPQLQEVWESQDTLQPRWNTIQPHILTRRSQGQLTHPPLPGYYNINNNPTSSFPKEGTWTGRATYLVRNAASENTSDTILSDHEALSGNNVIPKFWLITLVLVFFPVSTGLQRAIAVALQGTQGGLITGLRLL